ncbi:alpha-D-ribose 1-methylphosphonate 5-triphosphate diphosphatase [Caballeronia sp. LP006]|uniref:alpha-D-ribose 1-methylphosphonate 5-triphosphate diphosphatase n=1 Tax=Caballeronia sp. LP006 TaxID=3038552 RepID=UPI00285DE539|nr:alpha-D-ribose 1-methylphosphonate 5-triphosphate diphosphatase [Caballeronia sp. LP006]MDR5829482.1 alpha-D-ribose 1-methylphosphonate 5-triphosphate diphosphatase [Caballeronia sp. LP006]
MLITNARIVTRNEEFTGTVRIEEGCIADVSPGNTATRDALNWDGDYLLPGFVELHTDNIEKHLAPRPGVLWNHEAAIIVHDAQVASAGITTVFDALGVGSRPEDGVRGRELQVRCAHSIGKFVERGLLRADHFLHLRCEVGTTDVVEVFDSLSAHPLFRLASVMDHTPGQRQWQDHEKWRKYQERHGKWSDEHANDVLAQLAEHQARYAAAHRADIVARCQRLGISLASHDDTLIEHVEEAARDGIALAEFPTTRDAARAAREHGIATIMGAPNVVRGGSHSGNVSALELAREGLLDILSSDYVPSSLLIAVFDLVEKAGWTLPRAVATVSWAPAHAAGLADRGAIVTGLRADFVRVALADGLPVPRETYRNGQRVS